MVVTIPQKKKKNSLNALDLYGYLELLTNARTKRKSISRLDICICVDIFNNL